jgi:hypothetical protein
MSKLTPEKRKKIEKLVLAVFDKLDITGANTKKYKADFDAMSDKDFEKWILEFQNNEDKHFYLQVVPYHNEPTLDQIEEAAKLTKTQLHQYVYFKHDGSKDDPVRTAVKVPVGYIHARRLQQLLYKKTSYSTEVNSRNHLTGQLSGHDQIGRVADEEAYALKTVGAENVLKEVMSPRADNRNKRLNMYQNIERDGFVRYADLQGDTKDQATLGYMDTLLLAAGLKSDLVDPTLLLRVSSDKPQDQRKL